MKRFPMCISLPGTAGCRYKNFHLHNLLIKAFLLWAILCGGHRLAAQCPAGSFVPPSFLNTSTTGVEGIVWAFEQEPNGQYIIVGNFS